MFLDCCSSTPIKADMLRYDSITLAKRRLSKGAATTGAPYADELCDAWTGDTGVADRQCCKAHICTCEAIEDPDSATTTTSTSSRRLHELFHA